MFLWTRQAANRFQLICQEIKVKGVAHLQIFQSFDFFRSKSPIGKNNNRRCLGPRIAMERHDALRLALVGHLKVLARQITDNLIVVIERDNIYCYASARL